VKVLLLVGRVLWCLNTCYQGVFAELLAGQKDNPRDCSVNVMLCSSTECFKPFIKEGRGRGVKMGRLVSAIDLSSKGCCCLFLQKPS